MIIKKTKEDYIREARDKKDDLIRERAKDAVSRNEHTPIAKFKQEHLDKVEALFKQLKERHNVRRNRK